MAVESKPLFHPGVIRQHLPSFSLPESVRHSQDRLEHWAELITSGRADRFKETALLSEFTTDIFGGELGYTGPAGPGDTTTLSRENHVEVDDQFAVAIEGKGTRYLLCQVRASLFSSYARRVGRKSHSISTEKSAAYSTGAKILALSRSSPSR